MALRVVAMAPVLEKKTLESVLPEAIKAIDCGIQQIKSARFYYAAMLVLSVVLLLFTSALELPYGLNALIIALRVFPVMSSAFAIWMACVLDVKDKNSMLAVRSDMNRLLGQ